MIDTPTIWIVVAVLLALAELLLPGVFAIFLAAGAGITGAFLFLFPDLPLPAQLLSFAAWSGIAVAVGRRFYGTDGDAPSDPLLNQRAARLIGETVRVTLDIVDGTGRVRLGDGDWIARGPDAPAGTRLRVVAVEGTTLVVAPLTETIA